MDAGRVSRWSVDRWLTRIYARHGERYLLGALAFGFAIALLVFMPLLGLAPAHYLDLSPAEYGIVVAVAGAANGCALALAFAAHWRRLKPAFAWSRGEHTAELRAGASDWAFTAWRHAITAGVALLVVFVAPVTLLAIVLVSDPMPATDIVQHAIGTLTAGSVGALWAYSLLELVLRPLRGSLDRTELSEPRWPGTTTTLVPMIASLVFVGSYGTAYFLTDRETTGSGGLFVAFAVALALAVLAWAAAAPLLSATLLTPLREMIDAHRAVSRGELDTRIAVTTTDDLGELAASFNAMVTELQRRSEELREAQARLVAASDEARRRVERDLHDGAQQSLVLLNLKLGLLARQIGDPGTAAPLVDELRRDLERALQELRDLAHGIYPAILTSDGLAGALAQVARQASIPVSCEAAGVERLAPEVEAAIYFCCLEALQNAAKHAGAGASATVRVENGDGEIRFTVADDGKGFDANGSFASAGMQNMADRIGALGGVLTLDSAPGSGTTVSGRLPVTG